MEKRNNYTVWGLGEIRARKAYGEGHLNLLKHFKR